MTEWRLFPEGTVPDFTTFDFFEGHDWIPPEVQVGHQARQAMVAELVGSFRPTPETITDLGAGDGELLELLEVIVTGVRCWGYDAGIGNRKRAADMGRDVRAANIVTDLDDLDLGELVVCTEVVEHLLDPHRWLRHLATVARERIVVLSSPSTETDERHYEHHAWAWDLDGYAEVVRAAGFFVLDQVDCPAGFQAVAAVANGHLIRKEPSSG